MNRASSSDELVLRQLRVISLDRDSFTSALEHADTCSSAYDSNQNHSLRSIIHYKLDALTSLTTVHSIQN